MIYFDKRLLKYYPDYKKAIIAADIIDCIGHGIERKFKVLSGSQIIFEIYVDEIFGVKSEYDEIINDFIKKKLIRLYDIGENNYLINLNICNRTNERYPWFKLSIGQSRSMWKQNKEEPEYIYGIRMGKSSSIKLGKTCRPKERLKELQTSNPEILNFVFCFATSDMNESEKKIHEIFQSKRKNGEWFKFENKQERQLLLEKALECIINEE